MVSPGPETYYTDIWRIYYRDDGMTVSGIIALECPRCGREIDESEEHLLRLAYEDHLVMAHGPEFPPDHPFYRPTKTQRLIGWLLDDCPR